LSAISHVYKEGTQSLIKYTESLLDKGDVEELYTCQLILWKPVLTWRMFRWKSHQPSFLLTIVFYI